MKNISKMIAVTFGCGSVLLAYPSFGARDATPQIVSTDEADSGNWESPIVLDSGEIKRFDQIKTLIDDYIRKNHEGYKISGTMRTMDAISGERFILIVGLENDEDKKERLYFDMTHVYKKLEQSKDKETRKKIKELEAKHNPKNK